MARQQRDVRLQTRDARRKLTGTHEPFWHEVRRGLHLGYRKGRRAGVWYLKEVRDGRRVLRRLGIADDQVDADGASVLSWTDVLNLAVGADRPTAHAAAHYTVNDALEAYWSFRKAKSPSQSVKTDQTKAKANINAKLTRSNVADLTTSELEKWRNGLVATTEDREKQRRAQASANRIWTVLRAALNKAYKSGRVPSDDAWRRVEPFRNVDRPGTRFLSAPEAIRALNTMEPAFRKLARAALYTGLRLGELCRLRACDVVDGRVYVRISKGGKARTVPLSPDGQTFFEETCAALEGEDLIFLRADGSPWTGMVVCRRMRTASKLAKLKPPATFRDLRRSYGSLLINRGAEAEVIQELLGHADMRMTRRVYAHLLNSTISRTVKNKLPSFGVEGSNVKRLRE
jgi:integrase